MTFMDEIWRENDRATYTSIRQLQLWLSTISHVDEKVANETLNSLDKLIKELGHETVYDEVLGRNILK